MKISDLPIMVGSFREIGVGQLWATGGSGHPVTGAENASCFDETYVAADLTDGAGWMLL